MMLLPVALNLAGKSTLVVGGGNVAARKVLSLLECGARVTLISPALNADLEDLCARLKYFERPWQSGDASLDDFALIFACTDDRETNAQIVREARAANIWCNLADDAASSDFHGAATVRRGDICIGITSGGGSPALSRALKAQIEKCVGVEWSILLEMVGARRQMLDESVATQPARAEIWRAILSSSVFTLLKSGDRAAAQKLIDELMERKS